MGDAAISTSSLTDLATQANNVSNAVRDHPPQQDSSEPDSYNDASRKRHRSSSRPHQTEPQPPRLGRACRRCRRMKLRCVGDFPCIRCTRARQPCGDDANGDQALLHSPEQSGSNNNTSMPSLSTSTSAVRSGNMDPPTFIQPIHVVESGSTLMTDQLFAMNSDHDASASLTESMSSQLIPQVPLQASPNSVLSQVSLVNTQPHHPFTQYAGYYPPGPSRIAIPSSSDGLDLSSVQMSLPHASHTAPSQPTLPHGVRDTPENRLAIARDASLSQAAFRPLLIQSTAWGYTEASRPPSPGSGEGASSYGEKAFMEGGFDGKAAISSDPVNEGILDDKTADMLVDFFFDKCHQFMPVIHFPSPSIKPSESLRARSAFLYTVVLAIAARIYPRHAARFKPPDTSALPNHIPGALRQLAYTHLAATILRKQQNFGDLQSILMLSVWGLLGQGKGPDPWLLTGIVQRLSHRLELYRAGLSPLVRRVVDGGVAAIAGSTEQEKELLHKVVNQWRACLACFYFDSYLSLGFGRPLSIYNEPLNDELFVQLSQIRSSSSTLATDTYLVSQVQLARISRDFIFQAKCLNEIRIDPTTPSGSQFGSEFSICTMLAELNKRLDDWDFRWSWNGSLNVLQMGLSRRFAKLQAQHVRLSVNSVALRSDAHQGDLTSTDDTHYLATCVVKATEAAIGMIDMHLEALQSDCLFSYSFEYIFIALAQAALFIIRLYVAQDPSPAQKPVLLHYLRSAVNAIEDSDLSVTSHSTTMARILRDLIRAAGINLEGTGVGSADIAPSTALDPNEFNKLNGNSGSAFDFEAFLQMDALDYDYNFLFDSV